MNGSERGILPEMSYLRLKQIIGDRNAEPPIPPIVPVGKSTWWKWVQEGKAPSPIKLGPRVTVWRSEDIRQFVEQSAIEKPAVIRLG
jgi:predicted DNA-binding transcriptional regulator AlpA